MTFSSVGSPRPDWGAAPAAIGRLQEKTFAWRECSGFYSVFRSAGIGRSVRIRSKQRKLEQLSIHIDR